MKHIHRIVKNLALLAVITCWPVISTAGQSPEEMIQLYFDAFKKGDNQVLADNMHKGELARFKDALMPLFETGLDSSPGGFASERAMLRLFVGDADMEQVRNESPQDFFIRFLSWVMGLNPAIKQSMAGATIEIIGSVPEKDMTHVLYRMSVNMMGTTMKQLSVMSVKKEGDDWKLMLTGEIEGMSQMLKMNMNQR